MDEEYIDKEEAYTIGSGNLRLNAKIGDGQYGGLTVWLGYDKVGNKEDLSDEEPLTIGNADNCKGKTVTVVATITDVQRNTNWTSLTIDLFDDANSEKFAYKEEVAENAGTLTYTIKIQLN